MKIFKSKHKLKKEILNIKNISFIPTMGGLHNGHLSLIKKSKEFKGKILVSIFVNPEQFNKKRDFLTYPRKLKRDLKILKKQNIDFVYLPSVKDIFSFRPFNKVFLDKFSKKLCGKSRKGHFEGVLNVVNRFLEIIKPKYIFLGEKDFQQLHLIKCHIKKRNISTKVIQCKIIREKNGVACSTRNNNLFKNQLIIVSNIHQYLKDLRKIVKNKLYFYNTQIIKKNLIRLGASKVDYVEIYDLKTLKKPKIKSKKIRVFIAFYIDKVRLIDNI